METRREGGGSEYTVRELERRRRTRGRGEEREDCEKERGREKGRRHLEEETK